MASIYRSNHSNSSALSAEPAEPAVMDDTSRLRPRPSKDKFAISQSRTRVPSVYISHHESRGIMTAEDLLAAEPRTSSTHQTEKLTDYSLSRNVGPTSSASRNAGDLTESRSQRNEIAVTRPNAGGRGMISTGDGGVDRYHRSRDATEIPRTVQNLADLSDSLGSESSTSDGLSRVFSAGSITTSSRDFSGSSSSSQGQVATKAFDEYNEYARQHGLSPLEDEQIGNKI